jgi:hypothetical protein
MRWPGGYRRISQRSKGQRDRGRVAGRHLRYSQHGDVRCGRQRHEFCSMPGERPLRRTEPWISPEVEISTSSSSAPAMPRLAPRCRRTSTVPASDARNRSPGGARRQLRLHRRRVPRRLLQAVLGGILSRYNQIRHEIANGTFEPILWSYADGTVIGTDWAEGFMQGVGLRATKWERLFRSDDGADLISVPAAESARGVSPRAAHR